MLVGIQTTPRLGSNAVKKFSNRIVRFIFLFFTNDVWVGKFSLFVLSFTRTFLWYQILLFPPNKGIVDWKSWICFSKTWWQKKPQFPEKPFHNSCNFFLVERVAFFSRNCAVSKFADEKFFTKHLLHVSYF